MRAILKNNVPLTEYLYIMTKSNEVSKLEGTIAMFVNLYLSIVNMDHLVDLCKNCIGDCKTNYAT